MPEAASQPVAVAPVAPRQAAPVPVAATPPPPVQQPAPAAVQPSAPVVAAAPAVQPAAPAPQPQPAPAPVAPVVEKPEAKVVTASVQVPAPAAPEPSRKVAVAAVAASVVREKPQADAGERRALPPPAPTPVAAPTPVSTPKPKVGKAVAGATSAADPSNFDDSVDKAFEKELFSGPKAEDPRSKRTVYLPPEPGKESLSTSDVMQVVGSHKDGILSCIAAHAPPRDSDSDKGRFVLRWRVQPNGTASDVLMETEALKGTPFARCMEAQVRSWKFPQHRVQSQEPVRFPFTY
jgi:hypothetical protein